MKPYTDHDGLWLPTITYRRVDDDRRVMLAGMVHCAEPDFYVWADLLAQHAIRDGDAVCFEGVKRTEPAVFDTLDAREQRQINALRRFLEMCYELAAIDGLVKQGDLLKPRDSWINTDVPERALVKAMPTAWLWFAEKITNVADELGDDASFGEMDRDQMIERLGKERGRIGDFLFRTLAPDVVTTTRDKVAAHGILKQVNEGRDVLALWGAGHLPGIDAILTAELFAVEEVTYKLAIAREAMCATHPVAS